VAKVRPFRGVRYQLVKAGNPAKLVAPSFPVIDEARHAVLAEASPHNTVHLGRHHLFTSSEGEAPTLADWLESGVVAREDDPVMYLYERNYAIGGERHSSRGLLAVLRADESGESVACPFVDDVTGTASANEHFARLAKVNPYPVLLLYNDPEEVVGQLIDRARSPLPEMAITHDGKVEHRLFTLRDVESLELIADWFDKSSLIIGDGVGAYEGTMAVSRQNRLSGAEDGQPSDFVMAFFANTARPGLRPMAYHRIIRGLPEFGFAKVVRALNKAYDLDPVRSLRDVDGMLADAAQKGRRGTGFVLIGGGAVGRRAGYVGCIERDMILELLADQERPDVYKCLDVNVLDRLVFEELLGMSEEEACAAGYVTYYTDPQEAMQAGRAKDAQLLLMLNPLGVDEMRAISEADEQLPDRCVTFAPPLLSGLVMNDLSQF